MPQTEAENEMLQYLLLSMSPFFFFFVDAMLGNCVNNDYGFTLWFFLGVYMLLRFQRLDSADSFRQSFLWISVAVFAMVIVFIIQSVASPYLMGTARQMHFPMRELGVECDRIWYSRFDTPCHYVTGEWKIAGNAAVAMRDRPSVHFYFSGLDNPSAIPTGTWSTDEDVNQKGGIILWHASEQTPDWVHLRFPRAKVLSEILELPFNTRANVPPLRIGIALVPPPDNQ
jgi:hypothetical protein